MGVDAGVGVLAGATVGSGLGTRAVVETDGRAAVAAMTGGTETAVKVGRAVTTAARLAASDRVAVGVRVAGGGVAGLVAATVAGDAAPSVAVADGIAFAAREGRPA
ncbi:MAG: hypothetical protein QOI83_4949, partial [Streptomycetaceae bacterium]|nr:hypothetical protein [Streptomycetaceae bacterium]